jgi:UDP-N-acetylglucosamine 2-epimerase (non-hydrolysing)/UDP-GlcNAc3NAcA epimerase
VRVATIVGNRPQFIKAAAVSRLLRRQHEEVLIHTGQHYDDEMSRVFFAELEIPPPDRELHAGTGTNTAQTARMLVALERELDSVRPDYVLVYGDTNSTLAGGLAAAQLGIPVIHVEAGMRSFDRAMPEELNRVLTDHLSALLLCSTPVAIQNLRREGIVSGVHLVGDVMADVVLALAATAQERSDILERCDVEPGGYLLLTAHRAANVDPPARLARLVAMLERLPLPVVFPVHPRTRKHLAEYGLLQRAQAASHVQLLPPIGYLDLIKLAAGARAVLTDSGGLQKEAYVLGTQCITLRDRTEWVETVEAGWNSLVDLDADAAIAALQLAAPAERPPLYGDGHAGQAIVDVLTPATAAAAPAPAPRAAL